MKVFIGIAIFLFCMGTQAAPGPSPSPEAQRLIEEYTQINEWISQAVPDGVIGGYRPFVQMDGYKIIMDPDGFEDGHDTIRIFLNREYPLQDFAVTYHKTKYIVPGRTVLRRFLGPEPNGWRADTVDVSTGEYLGFQGNRNPAISPEEQAILDEWGIERL